MKIAVVGIWHLGEVVANSLAKIGHHVVAIDSNVECIENCRKGVPPLAEPGLEQLLKDNQGAKRIEFTTDFGLVSDCEAIFLTFDTPVKGNDEPDVSVLFDAVTRLAPFVKKGTLFVVMSQIPAGTTKELKQKTLEGNNAAEVDCVYFPENLRLGEALNCFLHADRFVIGADSEEDFGKIENILAPINCPRYKMSVASAEMSKHALNAFLATSLSFIYNISDICEAVGADAADVARALRSDPRIGEDAYLDTSFGFSGGTLMRDLIALTALGKSSGCHLPVIEGVLTTNQTRRQQVLARLLNLIGLPFTDIRVGILGVTYKPGTSTLRRSLPIEIIKLLQEKGVQVNAYDPAAINNEFRDEAGFDLSRNIYEMAANCNCLLLMTPWPEFMQIDFNRLGKTMLAPRLFFDGRNMFKNREKEISGCGVVYVGIGRV